MVIEKILISIIIGKLDKLYSVVYIDSFNTYECYSIGVVTEIHSRLVIVQFYDDALYIPCYRQQFEYNDPAFFDKIITIIDDFIAAGTKPVSNLAV